MKPRVCAVSYLNTTPLVWGLLHGPQQGEFDLRFEIPAVCAAQLRAGEVDIGLVPVIELERQALTMIPGLGIASKGPVRSILLISKVPLERVHTLALDASSRTSVVLARIILAEKFGVRPIVIELAPDVASMLARADACLVIGDPALRVHGLSGVPGLPHVQIYDLGAEWTGWTGLPMVYAVWAARAGFDWASASLILKNSWEFGRVRIQEIAAAEHGSRGITEQAAREYLTSNIHFALDSDCEEGLALFRKLARSAVLV